MEDRRIPSLKKSVLTLYGLGYSPGGATLASLVAVATWYVLSYLGASLSGSLIVFAAVTAGAMATLVARRVGGDPKEVVVDEFLGMYAALLFVRAPDYRAVLGLFIAFRVLDIVKIPPFSWIERWKSPGAILMDDVAIGLFLGLAYSCIVRWFRS